MREPMTEQRLREAQEVAWSPAYRPTPDFPEHVYRHDLFRDAVNEVERLRGTAREWRSTLAALLHVLAEHRVTMPIEPGRQGPPKLIADLMEWVATAVECETHWQRERAEQAEAEVERLREVETKLRGCLSSSGEAHQEVIRTRHMLDAMREAEIFELNAQLAEAATLLGRFVDHEDQPCRLDHHGACQEHGGSSLRPCDVAVGRELLARIRGGDSDAEVEAS